MRVLLINPLTEVYRQYYSPKAYASFPNGILSIAAVLEKHGHKVAIYDCFVDDRKPEDFMPFEPDIVGLSVITGPNLEGSIAISKEFRKLIPGVKVVWGNVHPSVLTEQTIVEPFIDYIAVGAGEFTLLELVQHLENGNPKLEEIKGLAYKKDGKVFINECRLFIKNLEELPYPAWHLVDVHKYSVHDLNTSRGCPHYCSFCYNLSYNKGYIGFISAEAIIERIEYFKKTYGIKYFRFSEDNFTFNLKRLREFCKLVIAKKLNITWSCDSRADLSEDDIALMAKSGCVAIGLGLETGSQRMLDFIQKKITVDKMVKTFWLMVKYKIRTSVYIMYGFPTETVEDFQQSHELLKRLDNPYYMYNRYVPFPGSALFAYCIENGLITPPSKLEDWPKFLMYYSTKGNLSQVPQEMMDKAADKWRRTYAIQRFRFTLKHNPSYFWIIFTNPPKFFREIGDLIKYHSYVNSFYQTVRRRLSRSSGNAKVSG